MNSEYQEGSGSSSGDPISRLVKESHKTQIPGPNENGMALPCFDYDIPSLASWWSQIALHDNIASVEKALGANYESSEQIFKIGIKYQEKEDDPGHSEETSSASLKKKNLMSNKDCQYLEIRKENV